MTGPDPDTGPVVFSFVTLYRRTVDFIKVLEKILRKCDSLYKRELSKSRCIFLHLDYLSLRIVSEAEDP